MRNLIFVMKHFSLYSIITIALMFAGSPVMGNPYALQAEPPLSTQIQWDLAPNGLLTISYDLDHNGKTDFYTVRTIKRSYISEQTPRATAEFYAGYPVFFVNHGNAHYFYITSKMPLFYATDFNEDGLWDAMYQDISEDGVNGNERFFTSPSGLSSKHPATIRQEAYLGISPESEPNS